MVLHWDKLVKFNYAAGQDVLYVETLDQREIYAPDIQSINTAISNCAAEHKIQHLLIDLSKNTLLLTETEFKAAMAQLAIGLLPSALKKVARIKSKNPERERMMERVLLEIQEVIKLPLEFRNFADRTEALCWLLNIPYETTPADAEPQL
ncbi:hypothetical protein [Botryobacter ruber]|uniref:hypothetical protein n=1 Tax=Botryobacter ruber TaxID=2171629 RepID=UPI000E0C955B|nr:hypothetical protein [Botryobacter ruber]